MVNALSCVCVLIGIVSCCFLYLSACAPSALGFSERAYIVPVFENILFHL